MGHCAGHDSWISPWHHLNIGWVLPMRPFQLLPDDIGRFLCFSFKNPHKTEERNVNKAFGTQKAWNCFLCNTVDRCRFHMKGKKSTSGSCFLFLCVSPRQLLLWVEQQWGIIRYHLMQNISLLATAAKNATWIVNQFQQTKSILANKNQNPGETEPTFANVKKKSKHWKNQVKSKSLSCWR